MAKNKAIASPATIKPFQDEKKKILRVIIETPKGSRNKFKYDPDLSCYRLNSVLPEGMIFPFDFGFVPCTKAADGDPLDVLLLMDVPAFPGIVVESRIVAVIEAEQTEDGKTIRNDRIVAVASEAQTYSNIKKPSDLDDHMVDEVERFFTNYNKQHGKGFRVIGLKGSGTAMKLIKKSQKAGKK